MASVCAHGIFISMLFFPDSFIDDAGVKKKSWEAGELVRDMFIGILLL